MLRTHADAIGNTLIHGQIISPVILTARLEQIRCGMASLLLSPLAEAVVSATPALFDAPTFNFTKCPSASELQSERVKQSFSLEKFVGTYYELAFHDLTQYPACYTGPFCIRSIKALDTERQEINDTWSLGCVRGSPINPYNVPLRFNLTNQSGFFDGWSPLTGKTLYPDTVVDYKLSDDGTHYEWVIEFQCEEADNRVVFTGINFYARHYNVTEAYYDDLIQSGRDAGLGVYMDHGEGTALQYARSCLLFVRSFWLNCGVCTLKRRIIPCSPHKLHMVQCYPVQSRRVWSQHCANTFERGRGLPM